MQDSAAFSSILAGASPQQHGGQHGAFRLHTTIAATITTTTTTTTTITITITTTTTTTTIAILYYTIHDVMRHPATYTSVLG